MKNVVQLAVGRPSPMHLQRYAKTQARRLLRSHGIEPNGRGVTANLCPSARTNLEATQRWIYGLIVQFEHLRAHTLDADPTLKRKLQLAFEERLADPFGLGLTD